MQFAITTGAGDRRVELQLQDVFQIGGILLPGNEKFRDFYDSAFAAYCRLTATPCMLVEGLPLTLAIGRVEITRRKNDDKNGGGLQLLSDGIIEKVSSAEFLVPPNVDRGP